MAYDATSQALSAAALAQSAAAQEEAHAAHVEACRATLQTYRAENATVDQMHAYAACVEVVYPTPMQLSPVEMIGLKAALVWVIAAAVWGAICPDRIGFYNDDIQDRILGFVVGAFGGAISGAVVLGLAYAVEWIIGG
jgi:hypothetical protein